MVDNAYEKLDADFKRANDAAEFTEFYIQEHMSAVASIQPAQIQQFINLITQTRDRGNTIYICGNGGKASLAMEFVNDLTVAIPNSGIKAHSLADPLTGLTCIGNDWSYDEIFSRRLEPLAKPGDLLIALSGSGTSKNVMLAVNIAGLKGMTVVSIGRGDVLADAADIGIIIDAYEDGPTEDATLAIIHTVYAWFLRLDRDR